MEDDSKPGASLFGRVARKRMSVLEVLTATVFAVLVALLLKGLVYTGAFLVFGVHHQGDLHATNLRAIEGMTDAMTSAQLGAIETRMARCRVTSLTSEVPLLDFWIDKEQLDAALHRAELACTKRLLDEYVLGQPRATMALAEEMRRIGYPLAPAYERGAHADAIALASLDVSSPNASDR